MYIWVLRKSTIVSLTKKTTHKMCVWIKKGGEILRRWQKDGVWGQYVLVPNPSSLLKEILLLAVLRGWIRQHVEYSGLLNQCSICCPWVCLPPMVHFSLGNWPTTDMDSASHFGSQPSSPSWLPPKGWRNIVWSLSCLCTCGSTTSFDHFLVCGHVDPPLLCSDALWLSTYLHGEVVRTQTTHHSSPPPSLHRVTTTTRPFSLISAMRIVSWNGWDIGTT